MDVKKPATFVESLYTKLKLDICRNSTEGSRDVSKPNTKAFKSKIFT